MKEGTTREGAITRGTHLTAVHPALFFVDSLANFSSVALLLFSYARASIFLILLIFLLRRLVGFPHSFDHERIRELISNSHPPS